MKFKELVKISLPFLAASTIIFYLQFLTPTLFGADGYLHIRMARFLRDMGPRYDFHWARFSVFNVHFSDKDFLYHILLVPFTYFKDIFFGAKVAAALFASFLFAGYYWLVSRYIKRPIAPFFLAAFFMSDLFLDSISRPRPIPLVILVTILSIHLMINKNHRALFFMALAYTLGHVTGPLIIVYAMITEVVRFCNRRGFYLKNPVFASGGVLLGFLIHPNFPNNLTVFYLNSIMVPLYTIKTGVLELGAEFFPLNTRQVLLGYPVIIAGIAGVIAAAVALRPKTRFGTRVFLVFAGIFFLASFICRRYLAHGYLVMLIAMGSYFSDAMGESGLGKRTRLFLYIILLIFSLNAFRAFRYSAAVTRIINGHYERVAGWMKEHIPPGELVFHANWSDSQYFIGLDPANDYFVTLDPVYMYHKDRRLYNLYRDVAFGRIRDPYTVLKDTFHVRYGYAGKNYFSGLIGRIRYDRRFKVLYEDNLGIVFELKS